MNTPDKQENQVVKPTDTISVTPSPVQQPINPLEQLQKPPVPVMSLPPAPVVPPPPASTPPAEMKRSPFRFLVPVVGIILLALIVAFIVSRLSPFGGGGGAAIPAEGITITYWGLWEPSVIMEEIIDQFEANNPGIKVVYQQQSIQDYRERLQNAMAEGRGPDVFRFHMTWSSLLSSELDVMPAEVLAATEFETQQYQVAKDWLRSGNSYVGIPLMYEGLGLFYNKQVFEAAGKLPPKTWEEMRRTALELTVKNKDGVIQRSGAALGTTANVDNWSDILGVMMLQNGANPANPTNALAHDALTFYTLFRTVDQVWDESMPSSTVAFATEKAAMMIAPSWRAHEVRAMNPDLSFAISELPQLPDTQIGWASIWVDGVSAQASSPAKTAGWKFLTYLHEKETLRAWYAAASKQRLFGEIFPREDMAEQLSVDPFVGAYLKQAAVARTWYMNSRTFDNGPNDKIIKYYEDAVNAVIKGEMAERSLSTTAEGVLQIINQYRLPAN